MTYIRGDKAQFDSWEAMGNPGWNWDTMWKYFLGVEKLIAPTPDQVKAGAFFNEDYHGRKGDLVVGFNPEISEGGFYELSKRTWENLGQVLNKDPNGGLTRGFSIWPQTLDPIKNKRSDAATTFLWPVEDRPNLELINGTASRVIWKTGSQYPEVEAVEYYAHDDKVCTVRVGKEAILSAGVLRTPLVLERSGIGNPSILHNLGIETVVDLPGVGENMIEQPVSARMYMAHDDFNVDGYAPYAVFATAEELFGERFGTVAEQTKRSLPEYARKVAEASAGGLRAESVLKLFEIQHSLMFEENNTVAEIFSSALAKTPLSAFWGILPFSRGSVHLSSASDVRKPAINPRFFQVPLDLDIQTAAGRLSSSFWESTGVITNPIVGLPTNASDSKWSAFNRDNAGANSHSLGSASMMSKELGGVVNPELKVYGTKRLRVVDASVLPLQFSGHLTATVYAVAQRAAEMILAEQ